MNYDKPKGKEFDESCSDDDHTKKGANEEDLDDSANTGKDKISDLHCNVLLKGWIRGKDGVDSLSHTTAEKVTLKMW